MSTQTEITPVTNLDLLWSMVTMSLEEDVDLAGLGILVSGKGDLTEARLERGFALSCPGAPHWGFQ